MVIDSCGCLVQASAPLTAQIAGFGSALEALLEILLHGGKTNVDVEGEVHILVFNNVLPPLQPS